SVGPGQTESRFSESRALNTLLFEHARDAGSFTSPVALVSFLVPAGLFGFVLACLEARRRVAGAAVFGLAMVGIIASYVRTALVAVVAGVLALAALLMTGRSVSRQLKWISAGLVIAVLAGGYGATLLAGDVNSFAK